MLGSLVVVVAAALAQPAFAARVDVQDGRLTVAADAAERLSVQIVFYRLPGVVLTDYQVSSFSPTDTVVTALVAGDGCTGGGVTRGLSSVRCPVAGVGAITVAGGDADDFVQMEGEIPVPTILSGGGL